MRNCDIYIAITTYDRPEEFQALLADIRRETEGRSVQVHVYDDASPSYYVDLPGFALTRYKRNHGKKNYWRVMNDVFRQAETWDFKYFFFLQDDCRLEEGFFDKAIAEFEAIEDPNKGTMCTFTPESVYERTMWSQKKAEDVTFKGRKFIRSHYVDCIFMCPRETLRILGFKIEPVPATRFTNNVLVSSRVGQQLTLRLMRLRKTMWCAYSSLVSSHSNESKMNTEERKKNPLNPLVRDQEAIFNLSEVLSQSKERVTVGIASIKSREMCLEKTINSLISQADELHIYLNDYEKVPAFVQNNPKIKFYLGKIYKDRGDTGKYFGLDKVESGYYFSCDDDLIYPPNYVEQTINYLKSAENRVIATYHGAILKPGILSNYYRDRKQVHYSTFQRVAIPVHIGGTGVMAFHVKHFRPDISRFKHPNMADIWVGIQAQELKIPIMCAPRPLNWIRAQEIPMEETIYGSKSNHHIQTQVLNEWIESNGNFPMKLWGMTEKNV